MRHKREDAWRIGMISVYLSLISSSACRVEGLSDPAKRDGTADLRHRHKLQHINDKSGLRSPLLQSSLVVSRRPTLPLFSCSSSQRRRPHLLAPARKYNLPQLYFRFSRYQQGSIVRLARRLLLPSTQMITPPRRTPVQKILSTKWDVCRSNRPAARSKIDSTILSASESKADCLRSTAQLPCPYPTLPPQQTTLAASPE
jgi:hypothetical protein